MKKPNYCKGVVVAHGKSEYLLAEHIKSNLHLPIEIYAEQNGKTSIQIDGLMKVLGNNIFKSHKVFLSKYYVENEKRKIKNFFLMPIMDLDDTDEEGIINYKSGKMFETHWLNPYIIPIWNDKNLDQVLLELGLISKIPNDKEKGKVYEELFPINRGESDLEQAKRLLESFGKTQKTNMDVFIRKCLESL